MELALIAVGLAALTYFGFKSKLSGPSTPPTPAAQAQNSGFIQQQLSAQDQQAEGVLSNSPEAQAASAPTGVKAGSAVLGAATGGIGLGLAGVSTMGLSIGASAALGAATFGVGALIGVFAIISAHHAAAVKNEAKLLNTAVPIVVSDVQAVVAAFKQRQINITQAWALLDQIQATYYIQVANKGAGSIEGRWPWVPNQQGIDPSTKPSTCNGPCTVGHTYIETAIYAAKQHLKAASDAKGNYIGPQNFSWVMGPIPNHAGFNGAPAVTITI